MVNNVVGPACTGCHYESWFALDKVAKVLTRRQGSGATMTFLPPSEGPQTVLDGETVSNDADLINSMVKSEQFKFRACRLAPSERTRTPSFEPFCDVGLSKT